MVCRVMLLVVTLLAQHKTSTDVCCEHQISRFCDLEIRCNGTWYAVTGIVHSCLRWSVLFSPWRHGGGLQSSNAPNAFEHSYSLLEPLTCKDTFVIVIPTQGADLSHMNFPGDATVPDTLIMRTLSNDATCDRVDDSPMPSLRMKSPLVATTSRDKP